MLGETIERYRVEACLGEGPASAVYRVRHDDLGSIHALKVPRQGHALAREQLLSEGRRQGRVHHPNLVAVTDVLEAGELPALVLEYVDGPSLEVWLQRPHPLPEVLSIFHGIVRGVEALHAAGLVHCALAPGNILLARTPEGLVPKVTGFGFVGERAGLEVQTDFLALGAILYEMVTGTPPGSDGLRAEERVPELPPEVSHTLHRLLDADPISGMGSCAELLSALYGGDEGLRAHEMSISLDPVAVHLPVPTTPSGPPPTVVANPWKRVALALVGLYGITAVGGVGGILFLSRDADAPSEQITQTPSTPPSLERAPPMVQVSVVEEEPQVLPLQPQRSAGRPAVVQSAFLHLEGDGQVELVGPGGKKGAAGEVQPGSWRYQVHFGSLPGPTGAFEILPGQTVTLRCSSFARRCKEGVSR